MVLEFTTEYGMITNDQIRAFRVFFKSKPELHDIMGNQYQWRMWFKYERHAKPNIMIGHITNYINPLGPEIKNPQIIK